MQEMSVWEAFDVSVQNAVICEKAVRGLDVVREVVDVNEKYQGPKGSSL